jgi:hypothetical protein
MVDLAEGEFLVVLRLDSAELRGRKADFCQVGRSVEVVLAAKDSAFGRLTQALAAGLGRLTHLWRQAAARDGPRVVEREPMPGS